MVAGGGASVIYADTVSNIIPNSAPAILIIISYLLKNLGGQWALAQMALPSYRLEHEVLGLRSKWVCV